MARFVSLDCEYVSVGMPGEARPDPLQRVTEVVQIGAIKVSGAGEELGRLKVLIKPTHVTMQCPGTDWAWFQHFTGLSYDLLMREGMAFHDAWAVLCGFASDAEHMVVMKGDPEVLEQDCRARLNKQDVALFSERKLTRVKLELASLLARAGLPVDEHKDKCSGELHTLVPPNELRFPLPGGATHDALFDAVSMANFLVYVNTSFPVSPQPPS